MSDRINNPMWTARLNDYLTKHPEAIELLKVFNHSPNTIIVKQAFYPENSKNLMNYLQVQELPGTLKPKLLIYEQEPCYGQGFKEAVKVLNEMCTEGILSTHKYGTGHEGTNLIPKIYHLRGEYNPNKEGIKFEPHQVRRERLQDILNN